MRIEFNAGLLNFFSVAVFKEHSFQFEKSVDTVKDGFDNIAKSICGMNGGVGILQDALDLVKKRVSHDQLQTENVHEARRKCAEFLEEVKRTDREVAQKVKTNTQEFCKKYPHLAPQTSSEGKNWIEDAWNWLVDKGKGLIDWGKKKVKDAVNWLKQAGKEFLDRVVNAAAEAVAWLVEQGKNIYEGIVTVFDFVFEGVMSLIDANIEFWGGVIEGILNGLATLAEVAVDFTMWVGETLAKGFVAVKEFVTENWDHLVDIAIGVAEVVSGVISVVAAVGETIGTAGAASPLAILQIIGGSIAIEKGLERIVGGVWGITDHEPSDLERIIFTPLEFTKDLLNNAVPGWHLGDFFNLATDVVSIVGDIGSLVTRGPEEVIKIGEIVGVTFDALSSLSEYVSSWAGEDSILGKVNDVISAIGDGKSVWGVFTDVIEIFK